MLSISIFAQKVGINITTPTATLEIVGQGSTSATRALEINSNSTELLIIQDDGKVGVGMPAPAVRLDIRAVSGNAAIGVGNTKQTAATAKSGAMRYFDSSGGQLHLSNGVEWEVVESESAKVIVLGYNSTVPLTFQTNTSEDVTEWVYTEGAGYIVNKKFVVPRDGVYLLSFTYSFRRGPKSVGNVESIWTVNGIRTYKCVNNIVAVTSSSQVGSTCAVGAKLSVGDVVVPTIYHSLSTDQTLRVGVGSDAGFNHLSIVEL